MTLGAGGPSGLWLLVLVSLVRGSPALVTSTGRHRCANRAEVKYRKRWKIEGGVAARLPLGATRSGSPINPTHQRVYAPKVEAVPAVGDLVRSTLATGWSDHRCTAPPAEARSDTGRLYRMLLWPADHLAVPLDMENAISND